MKRLEHARNMLARQSIEDHNYAGSGRMGRNYRSVASQQKGASCISELNISQHQAYINILILLMKLHSQKLVVTDIGGEIFAESLEVLTCEQLRLVKTSNSENHEIIQKATLNSKLDFEQNITTPSAVSIPSTPIDSEMNDLDEDNLHSSTSSVFSNASLEFTEPTNSKSSEQETKRISSLSDQQLKLFIKNIKQNEDFRSLPKTKKSSVIEEISKTKKIIPELNTNKQNSSNPLKKQSLSGQQKAITKREKQLPQSEPDSANSVKIFSKDYQQIKGFSVFYDEVIEEVKTHHPDMETEELIVNVQQMWSGLEQEDQQYYQSNAKDNLPKSSLEGDRESDKTINKAKVKLSPAGDRGQSKESPTNNRKDSIADSVPTAKKFKFERIDSSTIARPTSKSTTEECQNISCSKKSKYDEFRGLRYCSSDCCIKHCKSAFAHWIEQKKT